MVDWVVVFENVPTVKCQLTQVADEEIAEGRGDTYWRDGNVLLFAWGGVYTVYIYVYTCVYTYICTHTCMVVPMPCTSFWAKC